MSPPFPGVEGSFDEKGARGARQLTASILLVAIDAAWASPWARAACSRCLLRCRDAFAAFMESVREVEGAGGGGWLHSGHRTAHG